MASFGEPSANAAVGEEDQLREHDLDPEEEEEESDKEDFRDWQADEDEDADDTFVTSLFCSSRLPSITALVEHDKQTFHFDLGEIVKQYCTDDFSYIKLINFIRSVVQDKTEDSSIEDAIVYLSEQLVTKQFLEGEQYLKPVLENDALLFSYDDLFDFDDGDDA